MHLKNRPPIFVPRKYSDEIERLSKAALMDLVWDLTVTCYGVQDEDQVMAHLRERRDVVNTHRRQEFRRQK